MSNPRDEIEKLRKWRVHPPKDVGIGRDVDALCASLKTESEGAAEVGGVLMALLPDALKALVRVTDLRRGVLVLTTTHASQRYTLESWLRAGGLSALRAGSKTTIKSVKCQ